MGILKCIKPVPIALRQECSPPQIRRLVFGVHESSSLPENLCTSGIFPGDDLYSVWKDALFQAPDSAQIYSEEGQVLYGWGEFPFMDEFLNELTDELADSYGVLMRRIDQLLQKLKAFLQRNLTAPLEENHCQLILQRWNGVHSLCKSLVPIYDISTLPPPAFSQSPF